MTPQTFQIEKLDQFLDRAENFGGADPDGARSYCDALDEWLAVQAHQLDPDDLRRWRAGAYFLRGHFAYIDGNVESATDLFERASAASSQAGDIRREVRSLRRLALCYEYGGRQAESVDCIFRALGLAEELGDGRTIAKALAGLLALYESQGAYQQAIETAQQLHAAATDVGDVMLVATACVYTALFCGYLDRPHEGLEWINKALELATAEEIPHVLLYGRIYQMWLLGVAGRIDEAVDAAEQQLDIIAQLPAQHAAATYVDVAEIHVAAGNLERAAQMLRNADAAVGDEPFTAHLLRYHQVAADLHEARGETAVALRMLRRHVELDRELRGEQAKARLVTMERHFAAELAGKTEEIHHLRTVELVAKNEQLSTLIQQKDEILRVVAHDLRNPLAAAQLLGESLLIDLTDHLDADAVDRLESIGTAADEMRSTIDTLLDSQQHEGTGSPTSVTAAVELAVARARDNNDSCVIDLETASESANASVNGALLQRSLDDLLGYAIKASAPGNIVNISVRPSPNGTRITIAGGDVCTTDLWSDKRLYIARRLVERMRGSITLTTAADLDHPAAIIDLRT